MEADPKKKKTYKASTDGIRVKKETKKQIMAELATLNKKNYGRIVTADDLIGVALSLLTAEHKEHIKERSLSNKDRLDQKYQIYCTQVAKISWDEFYGLLIEGRLAGDGFLLKGEQI